MSDVRKMTEFIKADRNASQSHEWRQIRAMAETADALEGFRQDLVAVLHSPTLFQVVGRLNGAPFRRQCN